MRTDDFFQNCVSLFSPKLEASLPGPCPGGPTCFMRACRIARALVPVPIWSWRHLAAQTPRTKQGALPSRVVLALALTVPLHCCCYMYCMVRALRLAGRLPPRVVELLLLARRHRSATSASTPQLCVARHPAFG